MLRNYFIFWRFLVNHLSLQWKFNRYFFKTYNQLIFIKADRNEVHVGTCHTPVWTWGCRTVLTWCGRRARWPRTRCGSSAWWPAPWTWWTTSLSTWHQKKLVFVRKGMDVGLVLTVLKTRFIIRWQTNFG